MQNNNFSFWCPLGDINKATDPNTGEEIMLLGGIASTADEDSDGEFLDPKGFDIKPLLNSGLVNWHHQAKTNPGTIVGEPIKAEIRKEGLYIETKLYPHSQTACDIWELAKTLASDSKTRRLGYSIEGRVVKRKSEDPTSPDYKKIIKAIITGVAITHQPKNPKTFANIIKGEIDDISEDDVKEDDVKEEDVKEKEESVDVEESVNTESAAALKKESVDSDLKITTFSKSEVFDRIFHDIAGISIRKAKQIYSLIEKIADMKKEGSAITQEDIEKAYDALGLEAPIDVVKSEDEEDFSEEDETNEDEDSEEEDVKNTEDDETDSDEDSEDEDEDEEDEVKKSDFNDIEGMISQSHNSQARYIKAVAVLIKAQSNQLAEANHNLQKAIDTINSQNEIIKGYESQLDDLSEKISQIGSMTPAPKAIRHAAPVERMFKGNTENDFGENRNSGYKRISMSQRSVIADILDKATFAKGFDDEFSKATTSFEAGAPLSANVVKRIKDEYGIEIV